MERITIHSIILLVQAILFVAFVLQCQYGKPNKWTYWGLLVSGICILMQAYFLKS